MKLVYTGPHDAVEISDAETEFGAVAENGKPVEIPNDVAERLLEQDTWQKAGADKPAPKAKDQAPGPESESEQ